MLIDILWDVLKDTVIDCLKILPILYVTYLLIEYLEIKASNQVEKALIKAGRVGPIWGAAIGLIPQCGFSSAAASFFVTKVITPGTLVAVFLATSDEMLPILISSMVPAKTILLILLSKLLSGIAIGFIVDFFWKRHQNHDSHDHDSMEDVHELCERAHCKCHEGQNIFLSALKHTGWIIGMLFAVSFILAFLLSFIDTDWLSTIFTGLPVVGEIIAAILGLVPNCTTSVIITELYVSGVIGVGPLLSGVLVNAGVGLLVLYRTNRHIKENLLITGILLLSGVIIGALASLVF